ncbi:MAG: 3-keto-5-aminohexanoate cleavage protein [Actinobacteria bacterium]|nr:3-keto-5-aminohexanoate cleavage protein [Actinomycetota bacterium]
MTSGPVIVEAALNGITHPGHNPRVPVGPDELTVAAIDCVDAGATVVHTHAHNLGAPADGLTDAYAECYRAVLAERPGTILYPTTGLGASAADRYAHVARLASEGLVRAAFVDPGSVNLGGAGPDGLPPPIEYVYANTFADTRYAFDLCVAHGLAPSVAVFEPGFLQVVLAYREAGALPAGTLVKLYFAAGGYLTPGRPLWGVPPIAEGLDLYLAMLEGTGIPWAIAVVGAAALDYPITRAALERGGHLRIGLEDEPEGPANDEIVRRAADLCATVGRPIATLPETERILGLP